MATLKNTTINDTGFIKLATGTTAERPAAVSGMLRHNTNNDGPEYYDGSGWISLAQRDGSTAAKAVNKSTDILTINPSAPTGWYWLSVNGTPKNVYVDNTYDGGGWVMVGAHPINVSIPALTYAQAAQSTDWNGSSGFALGSGNNPKAYANWMGLAAWDYIATANQAGRTFVYFVAGSQVELSNTGSHNRRTRWKWTNFNASYGWTGLSGLTNEVGGVTPGFYSLHAQGYNFSAYNVDQDNYSGNCASSYNNAPFWYNQCWDGSFWGGNGSGYANATFWTGSGSDYYTYGACYIK